MIDIYKHDVENKISASAYSVRYMEKVETLEKLKDKFLEESQEMLEVYDKEDTTELQGELADILEVVDAIMYHKNISRDDVIALRNTKKEKRGGFEKGLYLESIDYFDK